VALLKTELFFKKGRTAFEVICPSGSRIDLLQEFSPSGQTARLKSPPGAISRRGYICALASVPKDRRSRKISWTEAARPRLSVFPSARATMEIPRVPF